MHPRYDPDPMRSAGHYSHAAWLKFIPPALRNAPEAGLDPEVAAWAGMLGQHKNPGNLVIAGTRGAGKTWNALHAVLAAYEAGWEGSAQYADPARWRQAAGRPYPPFKDPEPGMLGYYEGARVLVLDDLAAIPFGNYDHEAVYTLLNHRWEQRLPTVVTTNVADLVEVYGERVADRLAWRVTTVKLAGDSRRREA
jgi:DNA replication protein DnaC